MKISTIHENFIKIVQGLHPCGVYIPKLGLKIGKIFGFLSAHILIPALMGMKLGVEDSSSGQLPEFHPHRCSVSLCRAKKPQNYFPDRTKYTVSQKKNKTLNNCQ